MYVNALSCEAQMRPIVTFRGDYLYLIAIVSVYAGHTLGINSNNLQAIC